MSEYKVLTGRADLFDGAPPDAMVVLETNEAEPQLFYAVAHERGAAYWYDDLSPGRKIGLIALHEKTRVVASRVRLGGEPAAPKPALPVPNARAARMMSAQSSLSKAAKKSEPAPAPAKPVVTSQGISDGTGSAVGSAEFIRTHAAPQTPAPAKPQRDEASMVKTAMEETVAQIASSDRVSTEAICKTCGEGVPFNAKHDCPGLSGVKPSTSGGFVSLFSMGKARGMGPQGTFITLHQTGNLTLSSQLLAKGDLVDIQLDHAQRVIRIGKVQSGGRLLNKSKVLGCTPLLRLVKIPEGEKSVRIYLTEVDGWWQGELPK